TRKARSRRRWRRSRSSSRRGNGWARRELAGADARAGSRESDGGSPGDGEWALLLRKPEPKSKASRRRDAIARHPPRRPRRHPDGERRALALALLRRGADRRRDGAGEYTLQDRG